MQQREIEIAKLVHASEAHTVRKWDDSDIRPLKENIKRFGLLVPLLVIPFAGPDGLEADKYEVIDGNRRLRALREIHGIEDAKTTAVPCLVAIDAGVAEGLSANTMRQAMNPMDQYDVFAKLVAEGMKPKEISKLFDVPVKRVGQVLALASLAPSIRDAVREGRLSWESAEVLTMTTDHAMQEKLWAEHSDKHWNLRGALQEDAPDLNMAIFEKERYFVAGGHLLTDLFSEAEAGEEGMELCADSKIFWTLQHEAIELELDKFREQGWKAIMEEDEAGPTWGRHNWPKRSEIKSKKKRKLHSVLYTIREDGKFEIWDTVMPDPEAVKEDKAEEAEEEKVEAQEIKRVEAEAEKVEVEMTGNRPMSSYLVTELLIARSRQVKAALSANPRLAARVMVMLLAMADYRRGYTAKAANLSWSEARIEEESMDGFPMWVAFEKEYMALRDKPLGEMWDVLAPASFEELAERVGHVAARAFDAQMPGAGTLGKAILASEPVHGRAVWSPDETFWQSCGRAYMLQVLGQITSEAVASRYKNEKVAELAKRMERWFTCGGDTNMTWLKFGGKDEPVPESVRFAFRDWTPAILALPPQREAAAKIFADDFDSLDSDEFANENTADAAE